MLSIKLEQSANNNSAVIEKKPAELKNKSPKYKVLLHNAGYKVYGGDNAPYIWIKVPDQMTSWDFFDFLLQKVSVVGTPGSGFGLSGEGYFRLSAFNSRSNVIDAMERIINI